MLAHPSLSVKGLLKSVCLVALPHLSLGNVRLAGFAGDALVVAILILKVSGYQPGKVAMGAVNRFVVYIGGTHGQNEGHKNSERNPFRMKHGDSAR